jgi:hypothetical protein
MIVKKKSLAHDPKPDKELLADAPNFSKKFNMLFIFKVRDPIDSLGLQHEKEQVHLFLSE